MTSYNEILSEIPIIAAPLADYTDYPFRKIIRKFFSGLIFTEMISANALQYDDEKTWRMLETIPWEKKPIGIQLFGSDANKISSAIQKIKHLNPDVIDINFACPVKKVMKTGAGASILKNKEKGIEIAKAAADSFEGDVSVKLRLGIADDSIEEYSFIERLAESGIKAIFLHGRTAKQMYSGKANRKRILEIAGKSPIPVIASGDVFTINDARDYLSGGASGVLIARGMIGRPWFLNELEYHLSRNLGELRQTELTHQTVPAPIDVAISHMKEVREYYGERFLPIFRKHLSAYSKGLKNAAKLRNSLVTAKTFEEVEKIFLKTSSNLPIYKIML